ncbi:MAG: XRE family transcriptional regulator [Raoultibacter sp.]
MVFFKSIAKLYSVSIDDLLSGDELISFAEAEQKTKVNNARDLVFGLLDCMAALLFVLPFFGQKNGSTIETVPLFAFTDTADYIWLAFVFIIGVTCFFGVIQLALQSYENRIWVRYKIPISLALSVLALMFTIASRHPYPGAFLLCILVMKGLLVWKSR